jgi:hypothetical protein
MKRCSAGRRSSLGQVLPLLLELECADGRDEIVLVVIPEQTLRDLKLSHSRPHSKTEVFSFLPVLERKDVRECRAPLCPLKLSLELVGGEWSNPRRGGK